MIIESIRKEKALDLPILRFGSLTGATWHFRTASSPSLKTRLSRWVVKTGGEKTSSSPASTPTGFPSRLPIFSRASGWKESSARFLLASVRKRGEKGERNGVSCPLLIGKRQKPHKLQGNFKTHKLTVNLDACGGHGFSKLVCHLASVQARVGGPDTLNVELNVAKVYRRLQPRA